MPALHQVKALLKGTPEDRDVYITLAQMNSRLKRWPEAEEALDKAEQLSTKPEDKEYVDFLRGSTFERQKKYEPGGGDVPQGAGERSAERHRAELSRLHAGRPWHEAGRGAGHDQEGRRSRSRQRRLPRLAGLGLLQAGQVRHGGR